MALTTTTLSAMDNCIFYEWTKTGVLAEMNDIMVASVRFASLIQRLVSLTVKA